MTEVLALLIAGREHITKGWTKGRYERKVFGKPCYCVLGAIGLNDRYGRENPFIELAAQALLRELPEEFTSGLPRWESRRLWQLPKFNDEFAEKRDVLALYDRAIAAETERING